MNGKYFILNQPFCLRGYEKLPYALLHRPENSIRFVNKDTFWALSLCDGKTDCSLPIFPENVRNIVQELVKNGIARECEYGAELSGDQQYKLYENRYVRTAHWSITGKCNYRCRHCYMSAPEAKLGELPHETIMDIIRQIDECGITQVSLTGGEPLVRRDFEEIVRELSERKIRITQIYSNGFLVNEKLLDMLDSFGQKPEFNMSYDGDEGMHDWLRGIDRAGEIVLKAFDLCAARGFPIGSELCLHQKNKHLLRQSINTLGAHGVSSCKVNPVTETELWLRTTGEHASIDIEELFEIYLDYVPHFFEDGMTLSLMLGGFFWGCKGRREYRVPFEKYPTDMDCSRMTLCGHARNNLYISPEGRMLPCLSLSSFDEIQKDFPLITEIGLKKGLTDSSYMKLIDTRLEQFWEVSKSCGECRYRTRCGGSCRASALSTAGNDLMGCDRAACIYFGEHYDRKLRERLNGIAELQQNM